MDALDDTFLDVNARLKKSTIYKIADHIKKHPSVYQKARSVHACALFSNDGALQYFVEDVGRHNAVDAIAGYKLKSSLSQSDFVLYTTGRLTSEMVIKCAQMGFPFLMSRSGTTAMGLSVALSVGMTLISRCTGKHFLAVAHGERLIIDDA